LDNFTRKFKYSKTEFRRSGTQTAGLAFGGNHLLQEQQKNIMEQVGQLSPGSLNTARQSLAGCGTQTAALAFGGYIQHLIQQQLKNMMVQLGQQVLEV
jgi:hypothetical protein